MIAAAVFLIIYLLGLGVILTVLQVRGIFNYLDLFNDKSAKWVLAGIIFWPISSILIVIGFLLLVMLFNK